MAFSPQFLEELRNRLSIADIIGRKLRLQRRGREYLGLCPFHNEKTPSFTVSEEKGFFHCFGCGAHGDVVGFVMRSEGLSFPEAVEKLAQEAGLPVPASTPEERVRAQRQTSALAVLEAAAAWYERQLRAPAGRPALDYLKGRGLDEATIARFRLGYAPDSRNALKTALTEKAAGFTEALLVEAGLLIRPDGGGAAYDRFRGRVMFPITDRRGRVIAFGGRSLGAGEPKYLNSPETPLFQKGRTLYGLAQALRPARETGEVIVAEGYMDVIALAQAGFGQSVAPLGTALTEEQMMELWRLAPEPVLCFDGDAAGERAAARAADRALPLLKPGQSLRFALLPAGEDPDSLIHREGPVSIRRAIEKSRQLADIIWSKETHLRSLATPEKRAGLRRDIEQIVRRIPDRLVQEAYRREYAERMFEAFGYFGRHRNKKEEKERLLGEGVGAKTFLDKSVRRQQVALYILINYPQLIEEYDRIFGMESFTVKEFDSIREQIYLTFLSVYDIQPEELKERLKASGFSSLLEIILGRDVLIHAGFAKPGKDINDVKAGLEDIWEEHYQEQVDKEVGKATENYGVNPTDGNYKKMMSLLEFKMKLREQRNLSIASMLMRDAISKYEISVDVGSAEAKTSA